MSALMGPRRKTLTRYRVSVRVTGDHEWDHPWVEVGHHLSVSRADTALTEWLLESDWPAGQYLIEDLDSGYTVQRFHEGWVDA